MQEYSILKADALLKLELLVKAFVANAKNQILRSSDTILIDLNELQKQTSECDVFFKAIEKINEYRNKSLV